MVNLAAPSEAADLSHRLIASMATTRLINRRSLIKHLGASTSLFAASCDSPLRHSFKTPGARTFGIDVAKWGGEIDWHEVVSKLNPRFVFVQAFHVGKDEVSSYANPRFANYRRALQRLGDVLSDIRQEA